MIFMVIVMLVFLSGQLAAEEIVGKSMFPNIETPHPYPGAMEGNTLVWSETIYQGGAGWLKVHFSNFRLNDDDYVDLIDMYGVVAARIKGSDVSGKKRSRFKVKKNDDQKVSFWAPLIAGETLKIELHRDTNRRKGWGFTIDEVGVGFDTIETYPEDNLARILSICGTNNLQHIYCYYGYEPYDRGQAVGRMIFKRHGVWCKGNGFLLSCDNTSTFLTSAYLVWSQAVVDSLEVQFGYQYPNCNGTGAITSTTYFGDELLALSPVKKYSLVSLTDNPEESFTPLEPLNREPVLYEDIYLVQHPDGDPKKIGFGNVNSTTNQWEKYFYHYIDTPYLGSRGSAILTDDGDDEVLDKVLGFDDGDAGDCPNQAVKMKSIYNEIKQYNGCN